VNANYAVYFRLEIEMVRVISEQMNFGGQKYSLGQIRELDMVDYLFTLGHEPQRIVRGVDYWYLSPLRNESEASFKINRPKNRWYDHGQGKGGNLIDFSLLYFQCTVGEFLQKLGDGFLPQQLPLSSSQQQPDVAAAESKITILSDQNITAYPLVRYLHDRSIPLSVARQYCRQVSYKMNDKEYYGIGFRNDAGGYEIRNPYFKASSSPKEITTMLNGHKEAQVFEGFMDFLSFKTLYQDQPQSASNFIILNSAAFFEKARPAMEQHELIRLYLDRDTTGLRYTKYALSLKKGYQDESSLYKNNKDLNDWLIGKAMVQKKAPRHKMT